MATPDSPYEIRVLGSLGPAAREAFADLSVDTEPTATVLTGDLSQEELHSLLDRVRDLGLELVDVRQAQAPAGRSPAKDDASGQPSDDDSGDH